MKSHPLAELFPPLSDDELAQLAADIKENGLRQEIVTHEAGGEAMVLDGRHRLIACEMAGVEPRFVEWSPAHPNDSPAAYVCGQNLLRRHLRDDVRAVIAEQLASYRRGGAGARHPEKFTTLGQAASMLNVSASKVRVARDIKLYGQPEDVAKVHAGEKLGAVRAEVLKRAGKPPTPTPATLAKQRRQAEAAQPAAMPRLLKAISAARQGLKVAASGEHRGYYNTVQRCLQRGTLDEIELLEAGKIDLYTLDAQCAARTEPTLNLKATRGLMAQITACSDRLMLLDAIEDRAAKLEAVPELVDRIGKDRRREVLRKVVGALRLPLVSGSRWEQSAGDAKPPAETTEEFLARGGAITRMPTAIVGPSTGQIPPGERDAIVAHMDQREATLADKRRLRAARAGRAAEASASAQRGRNIDAALLPGTAK